MAETQIQEAKASVVCLAPAASFPNKSLLLKKTKPLRLPPSFCIWTLLYRDTSSIFNLRPPIRLSALSTGINVDYGKPVRLTRPLYAGLQVLLVDLLVQRWYNGCAGHIVKALPERNRWKVKVQLQSNATVFLAVKGKNMH